MPKERQGAVDGQDAEVSYKTHNKGISNADDTILLKNISNADFVQKSPTWWPDYSTAAAPSDWQNNDYLTRQLFGQQLKAGLSDR